jgi:hypothetical protein
MAERASNGESRHGPPPLEEWGRRLSDRVRAALDAGDLGQARRLATEGDGQARSLAKEFALMYRGLGITLRVLLGLLGDLPVRPDTGPLLGRFAEDMIELMAGAAAAPGAPAALGLPGSQAGEIDRIARLLEVGEERFDARQARLAREVVEAIDAGDPARARALVDDKERGHYLPLHDRVIRFMAECFAHVLEAWGPDELLRFHLATAEGQRAGFEKWDRMSAAEFAQASAFLLKQHMGQVAVREDEEKFVIEQAPCGSGGRLRLAGAYAAPGGLPMVREPDALTLGQGPFPVYCSHCPVWNGVAPIRWFGRPHWVFTAPARPDGGCTLHIYKRRDGAPAEYARRLGVGAPPVSARADARV